MAALISLSGCDGMQLVSSKPQVLSLPANGIVHKAELDRIAQSGKTVTYKGKADGVVYEWTFIGSQIKKTADVNLKLSFKSSDEGLIKSQAGTQKVFPISFAQKGNLAGTPSLSVQFGENWPYGTYYLYSGGSNPTKLTKTTAQVNPSSAQSVQSSSSSKPSLPAQSGTAQADSGSAPSYVCNMQIVDGIGHLNLARVDGEYFVTSNVIKPNADDLSASSSSSGSSSSQANGNASPSRAGKVNAAKGSAAKGSTGKSGRNGTTKPDSGGSGPTVVTHNADDSNINVPDQNGNNYDNGYGNGHPAPWLDPLQDKNQIVGTVTYTIRCDTAVKNWDKLRPNKRDHKVVPADGTIYALHTLNIYKNETVYDLLISICESNNIQEEHSFTLAYKSEYIRGINNLYEFDGGPYSGWMYCVNGWYPNYGCSKYVLQNGDNVQWNYTCDLGRDLGQNWIG